MKKTAWTWPVCVVAVVLQAKDFRFKAKAKDLAPEAKAKAKDLASEAKAKAKDTPAGLEAKAVASRTPSLHLTKHNQEKSTILSINCSVVQGSGMGPVNVNASDIHPTCPFNIVLKYADDTYLIVPSVNSHLLHSEIQQYLRLD